MLISPGTVHRTPRQSGLPKRDPVPLLLSVQGKVPGQTSDGNAGVFFSWLAPCSASWIFIEKKKMALEFGVSSGYTISFTEGHSTSRSLTSETTDKSGAGF